jgi:hypothetical protein
MIIANACGDETGPVEVFERKVRDREGTGERERERGRERERERGRERETWRNFQHSLISQLRFGSERKGYIV